MSAMRRETPRLEKLWSVIDWFIPHDQAELSRDKLIRFRALICAAAILSLSHMGIALLFGLTHDNHLLSFANLVLGLLLGMGPLVTKLSRSLFAGSMHICGLLLAALCFLALHQDGYYWLASAWAAIVPVLAMFLIGTRGGLVVFVADMVLSGLVVHLHTKGVIIPGRLVPPEGSPAWILNNLIAAGILIASTYYHTHSRERTLQQLAESQGKLLALVQSSSDFIFAIDASQRLTTFNPPFYNLLVEHFHLVPVLGNSIWETLPSEHHSRWRTYATQVMSGQDARFEEEHTGLRGHFFLEVSLSPITSKGAIIGITCIGRDITQRKQDEKKLEQTNARLISLSREAGMSDVATGILHNVGNVLNSVNISVGMIGDKLEELKIDRLQASASLLCEHAEKLNALSSDPKLSLVPRYLVSLGEHQGRMQALLHQEVKLLARNVDHIKHIISMQQ
ncbi:MAG: PAS domain-containing protein, partial [Deltaproteobacteria bacterium]|nr:PAS domain-containing protein [Deltaproteobacteria bacterium]